MYQDYVVQDVRAAGILTGSYVAGTVLGPSNVNPALRNQLNLLVAFTIGSLTDGRIKVEYSLDGSTWFQDSFLDVASGIGTASAGVYKFTATGNYLISIPIKAMYIRVSAMGTGTVDNSSMTIKAIVGNA